MMDDQHTHSDFAALTDRERYKLLIGTVIPRPIALITTVGLDGRPNAGPFSFFNVLTHDPAIVAVGVENHPDMRFKDTASADRKFRKVERMGRSFIAPTFSIEHHTIDRHWARERKS